MLKTIIKKGISSFLYYSGITYILSDSRNHNIIIGYHRVLPADYEDICYIEPGMFVKLDTFIKHINYLNKNYDIISFSDLNSLKKPKNKCIITFDDGWKDNYQYAFPVLKDFNVKATIFLTTNFIGSKHWPWSDKISFLIHHLSTQELENLFSFINKNIQSLGKINRDFIYIKNKYLMVEKVIRSLKKLTTDDLLMLFQKIDELESIKKINQSQNSLWLDWPEIKEMAQYGIDFGAHTHNHYILTQVSLNTAEYEVKTSKKIINEKLGFNTDLFCYPNGNFNSDLLKILKAENFKYAVLTKPGTIDSSVDNLSLERILLHDDMTNYIPQLACKLTNKIPYI